MTHAPSIGGEMTVPAYCPRLGPFPIQMPASRSPKIASQVLTRKHARAAQSRIRRIRCPLSKRQRARTSAWEKVTPSHDRKASRAWATRMPTLRTTRNAAIATIIGCFQAMARVRSRLAAQSKRFESSPEVLLLFGDSGQRFRSQAESIAVIPPAQKE